LEVEEVSRAQEPGATDVVGTDKTAPHEEEEYPMRVAITAAGPDLSSPVDQRFGRAHYLLVVDTPERTALAIDNLAGMNAAQGAGIQAAQSVIDNHATTLVTGHCGPKAFRALKAAGVDVYLTSEGTVADAIDRLEAGELALAPAADVDGHW
jgi:predicted Fe-Mo cluster-binding NifX family protein